MQRASVQLYDYGAEGYVARQGGAVYDILAKTWHKALVPTHSIGNGLTIPQCTLLPEPLNAVICTPQLIRCSNTLEYWTVGDYWTENTIWDDVPFKGLYYYGVGELTYVTSNFDLPEDPMFWVEFVLYPQDKWLDEEPYLALIWGGGTWAIARYGSNRPRLYYNSGSEWRAVAEFRFEDYPLDDGWGNYGNGRLYSVLVLHLRGMVAISTDNGESWTAVEAPTTPACPQGGLTFYIRQGECHFALHEVAFDTGVAYSAMHTLFDRQETAGGIPLPPSAHHVEGIHYGTPGGTSVEFIASPQADPDGFVECSHQFRYKMTLTPARVDMPGAPVAFYRTPWVVATDWRWATTIATSGGVTELADLGTITSISTSQDQDMSANRATVQLKLDPNTPLSGEYRWRYMRISVGDDAVLVPKLAGYITRVSAAAQPQWESGYRLTFDVVDESIIAKRVQFDESFPALDGATVNDALDYLAMRLGVPTTRRAWHSAGDDVVLDYGPPEEPFWWVTGELRAGMSLWDCMQRIASIAGMELFVDAEGVWRTMSIGAELGDLFVLDATGALGIAFAIESAEYELANVELVTATGAFGEDRNGNKTGAWAIDYERESEPGTATPFAGRRFWKRREGREFTSQAMAVAQALSDWDNRDLGQRILKVTIPGGNPQIPRRSRIKVYNAEAIGVSSGQEFMVVSVRDKWAPQRADCETTVEAVAV